jgi:UDP-N-acetylmuramoyl-L-alanyl-D-glutamate--2,6-diaminopimelate ligase
MSASRHMGLGELADIIGPERVVGVPVGEIGSIAYDSREVSEGTLFFAVPGVHVDGHDFIADAVARGAAAVVAEREAPGLAVPQLVVARTRDALADAADAWYGRPSERLEVIGVTGTDGKTTTCFLAVAALQAGGRKPGMIGTVAVRVGDDVRPNEDRNTTPEAPELQAYLAEMLEAGNDNVVMEATSHGLAQSRVRNCRFRVAVVTNLTSEHLEFHGTLEAYRAAKAMLVAEAPTAILNADDPAFGYFRDRARDRVVAYGTDARAHVRASEIEARADGTTFTATTPSWSGEVHLQLPGAFNVHNALAALALAEVEGVDAAAAADGIGTVAGVPGRMERIAAGQPFGVVVDYAHTADSLGKVLRTLRPLSEGRLIVVFGSAGERDRVKRPAMGKVAAELADLAVVTDEDPRLEDGHAINEAIAEGARSAGALDGTNLWVIDDRREAIAHAIGLAQAGDVILLAGKGHEGSIFYANEKRWWDEREVARQELAAAGFKADA